MFILFFIFFHPFYPSCSKNVPRHKRFERLNSNKNRLWRYKECVVSYCLNSLWEHTFWKWTCGVLVHTYLLVVKKYCFNWHITLGCEHILFILFHLFLFFIHFIFSYVINFHPFSFFIFGHVVEYSSTSWNIICHVSTKYSYKNLILFTYTCSPNNNHVKRCPPTLHV